MNPQNREAEAEAEGRGLLMAGRRRGGEGRWM